MVGLGIVEERRFLDCQELNVKSYLKRENGDEFIGFPN